MSVFVRIFELSVIGFQNFKRVFLETQFAETLRKISPEPFSLKILHEHYRYIQSEQ